MFAECFTMIRGSHDQCVVARVAESVDQATGLSICFGNLFVVAGGDWSLRLDGIRRC